MHAVTLIDEIDKRGSSKIHAACGLKNLASHPTPIYTPEKGLVVGSPADAGAAGSD